MKTILKPKDKISRKAAVEKIVILAKFGNHSHEPRPKSGDDIEMFFRKKGIEPKEIIQEMRDPNAQLAYFENLVGATWGVQGGKVSALNEAGEVEAEVESSGQISMNICLSHFEAAIGARDKVISELSYHQVYQCITFGFSSIEAFFYISSKRWNREHPKNKLNDKFSSKVSLETKILEWIPIMSEGAEFDKTNRQWSDFKALKRIRDEHAIHPGIGGLGMSHKIMANHLNAFRYGIAQLLGNLHILLGQAIPSKIINAVYFPDIEVKQVYEKS